MIFDNNYSVIGGAVILIGSVESEPLFKNCTFINNDAVNAGVIKVDDGVLTLEYCCFINNHVHNRGSAIYSYSSDENNDVYITNCTFFGNQSNLNTSAVYMGNGDMAIVNTIITGTDGRSVGISNFDPDRLSITYCDFWDNGGGSWSGDLANYADETGNMSSDPCFVDPENNNLHLGYDSPCIDAGDPESPNDEDGSRADIGAFNTEPVPDYSFVMEAVKEGGLCNAGEETTCRFSIEVDGQLNDTYMIDFSSELPDGWTLEYVTSAGRFTGASTLSLDTGDTSEIEILIGTSETNPATDGTFEFTAISQGDNTVRDSLEFYVMTAGDILFINSDPDGNYTQYYSDAIEASINNDLDVEPTFSQWVIADHSLNGGDLADLQTGLIVWCMGLQDTLISAHQQGLLDYLSNGNSLFISGANAPNSLDGQPLLTMMGAGYDEDYIPVNFVIGEDDDPVADGLVMNIIGGDGADTGYNSHAMILNGGIQSFFFAGNAVAGIRMEGDYKSLLLSFPFESISREDYRFTLMTNILLYFGFVANDIGEPEMELLPERIELMQNYPNPFNSSTQIRFALPEKQEIKLSVYNTVGQLVTNLADGTYEAGYHTVCFKGQGQASGMYYCRLFSGSTSQTKAMLFVK